MDIVKVEAIVQQRYMDQRSTCGVQGTLFACLPFFAYSFICRCIMLELFCKKPVFQGNDEINQLEVIYRIMGTPTVECWPGLIHMPWYELVKPKDMIRNRFRDLFQKYVVHAN